MVFMLSKTVIDDENKDQEKMFSPIKEKKTEKS